MVITHRAGTQVLAAPMAFPLGNKTSTTWPESGKLREPGMGEWKGTSCQGYGSGRAGAFLHLRSRLGFGVW